MFDSCFDEIPTSILPAGNIRSLFPYYSFQGPSWENTDGPYLDWQLRYVQRWGHAFKMYLDAEDTGQMERSVA